MLHWHQRLAARCTKRLCHCHAEEKLNARADVILVQMQYAWHNAAVQPSGFWAGLVLGLLILKAPVQPPFPCSPCGRPSKNSGKPRFG